MPMKGRITIRAFGLACLGLALGFVLVHFGFAWLIRRGMALGAVEASLAPLYAYWNPHLKPGLLVPVAWLLAYLAFLRKTGFFAAWDDRAAVVFFCLAFLTTVLTVPLIDGGPEIWIAPFANRADVEYYGAIDHVGDIRGFLHNYVASSADLPMHARTHPPGAILLLAGLSRILGGGPWAAAFGAMGFSTLVVPFVFLLGRSLGGPSVARQATAWFTVTPNVVLFTATSMDGPFMVFLVGTMAVFWLALACGSVRLGCLAGILAGLAAMLTFSTAIALVFCGLASLAALARGRPPEQIRIAGIAVAAVVGMLTLLLGVGLLTGYDTLAMLRSAVDQDHRIMGRTRHVSWASHAALAAGNLTAFGFSAGLPVLALWLSAIAREVRKGNGKEVGQSLRVFTLCGLTTIMTAAALPVYSLEVERIWIFLTPLLALPAAGRLEFVSSVDTTTAVWVVRLLAIQTVSTELLLGTYW
jgi:hypothetical protein